MHSCSRVYVDITGMRGLCPPSAREISSPRHRSAQKIEIERPQRPLENGEPNPGPSSGKIPAHVLVLVGSKYQFLCGSLHAFLQVCVKSRRVAGFWNQCSEIAHPILTISKQRNREQGAPGSRLCPNYCGFQAYHHSCIHWKYCCS